MTPTMRLGQIVGFVVVICIGLLALAGTARLIIGLFGGC